MHLSSRPFHPTSKASICRIPSPLALGPAAARPTDRFARQPDAASADSKVRPGPGLPTLRAGQRGEPLGVRTLLQQLKAQVFVHNPPRPRHYRYMSGITETPNTLFT
jgi:hypothetical protein